MWFQIVSIKIAYSKYPSNYTINSHFNMKRSKPEEQEHENTQNGSVSTDIFKALFSGAAPEEPGLGFCSDSNPRTETVAKQRQIDRNVKELGPNRVGDGKRSDLGEDGERIRASPERAKKPRKAKAREEGDGGVESVANVANVANAGSIEGGRELVGFGSADQNLEVGLNEKLGRKKKRKRAEIEEEYESRDQLVVAKIGGDVGKRAVGEKRKTVEDPSEMMISKEGFDDEDKLLRTVFVGNLPLKLKKKALLKEFGRFGEIDSARIRSVPLVDSKTPRKGAIFKGKINESVDSVHAYIVFKDEKAAQASLSHNMAVLGGNHIRVDMACPPRKKLKGEQVPLYDNKRTVFVGNLPFDVKDEEVYQLFCGIEQLRPSIEGVRVIRDPNTSIGKGIAYILFKTRDAANQALRKKHLKLRDRELRLNRAVADSTPSKRKNPMASSEDTSPTKRLAMSSYEQHKNNKEARGNLSYQGLKAKKLGVQKKDFIQKKSNVQGNKTPITGNAPEGRVRKNKRPAVAARKANALKGIVGPGKQTGMKRKVESRTPESSHRSKKARTTW
ncbi:hypothetical protein Syun_018175 [Stephania yunnanensis]|uniref:RRM domain-containing protein n=1 Tax=Stephania yunnanensis TaxID=152371 RepID=A0AAP0IT83_9MAGN